MRRFFFLAALSLTVTGTPAGAYDRVASFTELADGWIEQGFLLTRHFYRQDPFEQTERHFPEEEAEKLSFAEHHQIPWRWDLGYSVGFRSLPAIAVPGGTLPATTQDSHLAHLAFAYEATGSIDLQFDLDVAFIPAQETTGGHVGISAAYLVPFRTALLAFGIEPPRRGPDEPEKEEEIEARLIGGKRRPRGWASQTSAEWRLDRFRFDPAVPVVFLIVSLDLTRTLQQRQQESGNDFEVFQSQFTITAGWANPRWTAAVHVQPSSYTDDLAAFSARIAGRQTEDIDYRGFLAFVGGLQSLKIELEGVFRPEPRWELGLRTRLITAGVGGDAGFGFEGTAGRLLSDRWAGALGGELTLLGDGSAVAGRLALSYFW